MHQTLIDSELFGHEKGAFTSAVSRRLGKVELAEGGTLFLDEIGDMTLDTQVKLLRLLEERTFERVGGSQTLTVQTRIVAATNRNLKEIVSAGDFREDLYYRLNAFPIYLPPLRERKEDIPRLSEFFKNRMAVHIGKDIGPLKPGVIEVLQSVSIGLGMCVNWSIPYSGLSSCAVVLESRWRISDFMRMVLESKSRLSILRGAP